MRLNQPLLILVVEDEPTIRVALSEVLGAVGYTVRITSDIPAALEAVGRFAPDILIVDLDLARGSALDLIAVVKSTLPTTDIIVLGSCRDARHVMNAGVSLYLNKPFDLEILLSHLLELVKQRASR